MIAEAQDSSLEKALIRKVQGFFHHSGGTAGPFTLNEPFRFDFKMCLVRPPGLEPRSVP